MHTERLSRLVEQIRFAGLDIVALMPGPNLFYLTGLSFHLSERPVLTFFRADGTAAIALPHLEAVKVELTDVELEAFSYTDGEGPEIAFRRAADALELGSSAIGVEALHMRVLESQLLERHAPGCRLVPAEDVLAELRVRKDAGEIERMRRAIAVTEAALQAMMDRAEAGMTERELVAVLQIEILRAGGDGMAFSPIVAAGPNAALPHATPTDRPIGQGEPIIVDCGALVDSYMADITRTFVIGELEPELACIYEVVRAANRAGREAVRHGIAAEEVDRAARAVIEGAGYGEYFSHRTGHGLGLEVHERPYIVEGNERLLEPGMTFTVEPGVYLPGRGGVRIEDDVLVAAAGGESLTTFPRELLTM